MFIPVQNTQPAAVKLQSGIPLGVVERCESEPTTVSTEVHAVSAVVQAKQSGEREEQHKKLLNLPETGLTAVELGQLQQTDGELGCTGIVKHDVDTEGHPPIKQQVRHTPFI